MSILQWYIGVLKAPLRLLARWIRTFVRNRDRVSRFAARERIALALKVFGVATVGAWIIIWLLADEAQRGRLTETVKAYLAGSVENAGSGRE